MKNERFEEVVNLLKDHLYSTDNDKRNAAVAALKELLDSFAKLRQGVIQALAVLAMPTPVGHPDADQMKVDSAFDLLSVFESSGAVPWSQGQPSAHACYLLRRGGQKPVVATPCYGMHEPWWLVSTLDGELEPVAMQDDDEWLPVPK